MHRKTEEAMPPEQSPHSLAPDPMCVSVATMQTHGMWGLCWKPCQLVGSCREEVPGSLRVTRLLRLLASSVWPFLMYNTWPPTREPKSTRSDLLPKPLHGFARILVPETQDSSGWFADTSWERGDAHIALNAFYKIETWLPEASGLESNSFVCHTRPFLVSPLPLPWICYHSFSLNMLSSAR